MSGFTLTIIVRDKKISKESNFFSDLNFNKQKISCSLLNYEFSINDKINIKGEEVYVYDNFYIEYNDEIKNYGYSDFFWKKVIERIDNPQCSIDINSMSRDYGSLYIILKHIEQLLQENYHFYLITNNLSIKTKKAFENSIDLLILDKEYYLISEKIIDYLIRNEFFDFIEY